MPKGAVLAAAHSVHGWAWSGTTGWISMNCNDPGTGGCGIDYGLDINNTGNISGWAWSTNAGWICFGAACTGAPGVPGAGTPAPDHFCASHTPCAMVDSTQDQLHGWAYAVSESDDPGTGPFRGWISLNCTDLDPNSIGAGPGFVHNCGGSDYSVHYDEPSGEFNGYAWNGNGDSTGNGWIQFACGSPQSGCPAPGPWGVSTDWILPGWSSIDAQEGVYSPPPPPSVGTALNGFPIVFRNFSGPKNSTLKCYLRTSSNAVVTLSWSLAQRYGNVTYSQSYTLATNDAAVDASGNPVLWTFSGAGGVGCEIIGTPSLQRTVPNGIPVHPNNWTFTGPGGSAQSDSNRAAYCLQGNNTNTASMGYFLDIGATNAGASVKCDVEGDLAFTLLKAKGVPVELVCRDNADNDANLQADCAGTVSVPSPDRDCRGIAFVCIPHPTWNSGSPPQP